MAHWAEYISVPAFIAKSCTVLHSVLCVRDKQPRKRRLPMGHQQLHHAFHSFLSLSWTFPHVCFHTVFSTRQSLPTRSHETEGSVFAYNKPFITNSTYLLPAVFLKQMCFIYFWNRFLNLMYEEKKSTYIAMTI